MESEHFKLSSEEFLTERRFSAGFGSAEISELSKLLSDLHLLLNESDYADSVGLHAFIAFEPWVGVVDAFPACDGAYDGAFLFDAFDSLTLLPLLENKFFYVGGEFLLVKRRGNTEYQFLLPTLGCSGSDVYPVSAASAFYRVFRHNIYLDSVHKRGQNSEGNDII